VRLIEIASALLLVLFLIIPMLRAMRASRPRVPHSQVPAADETVAPTKVRRRRRARLGEPDQQRVVSPALPVAEKRATSSMSKQEIAEVLTTLKSGAAGLRQGFVLAAILAPPGGIQRIDPLTAARPEARLRSSQHD
jgi:hypothetical protein